MVIGPRVGSCVDPRSGRVGRQQGRLRLWKGAFNRCCLKSINRCSNASSCAIRPGHGGQPGESVAQERTAHGCGEIPAFDQAQQRDTWAVKAGKGLRGFG